MIKYETITVNDKTQNIKATFDNSEVVLMIPIDKTNSDYQRYLNPEAEQSTPIVKDEAKTK
jgi:hypothetical protein